ncbi:MAG: hypothetical protein ABS939_23305 [Psychrobacillus sp.]
MRTLFTVVYFFTISYFVYADAPSRMIFASIPFYLGGYFLICFIEDFLIEFRKERDKNND